VDRVLSAGSGEAGLFAFGERPHGFVAVGGLATGFIAIGQGATGVIAIGQLARGVIAIGQLAIGVIAVGQGAIGVLWCAAMVGVAGTRSPGLLVYGLLERPRVRQWPRRLLARREPWDTAPRGPRWRLVAGIAGLTGLAALWWFLAGQALLAAVS
jgi:hypothetical protein